MASSASSDSRDWLAGFELGEQLEANAFTATFRALRRTDRRRVLVRTMKPGLRQPDDALTLLGRELDVVSSTLHPSLPILLETVRAPKRLALVYADAGGHRLTDIFDRTPRVAPASALAIAEAIASVLAALHRAGFVHGRLRAESIELTEQGLLILHDPAGVGARGGGGDPDLDAPENMAPEQVLGQTPGPETDVYLLGRLMFQLVAGALPFGTSVGGITQQIRHAEAPQLSTLAPDAPRELQRIVSRCLRKRGRDRYPDMASLESELLRVMRSSTSLSREHLVALALADAGLAAELPRPRERGVARGAISMPLWVQGAMRWGAVGLGAIVLVAVGWTLLAGDDRNTPSGPQGIVKRPAQLRVLARPWAEIYVDGELVDVTPVGRAIEVTPGRHVVELKHPNADPITREVEVIAGQTVLLDVEMQVKRPPDAGVPDVTDAAVPDAEAVRP